MKKLLCTLLTVAIVLTVLPAGAFAKSETVTLYGNKISVHAKQICFVKGSEDENSYLGSVFDSSFEKYYYVGDETIDFKVVAEKLPELQNLVVVRSNVKNVSALSNLKDLVWLGLHQCGGSEDLSFLKKLTGLKKFRYSDGFGGMECESIKPVSYLKNLTELYINVKWSAIDDITPLKGLTKLKKLDLRYVGGEDVSVIKNFKNLKELELKLSEPTDMTFLSSLTKLERLGISGNTKNLSAVTKLKNLKKLYIDANEGDLSFIGDMTELESLHISYSGKSFTKTIGKLKNLKELTLNTINNGNPYDTSFIPKLTSLESLDFTSNYDYDIDVTGISKLKKLKSLTFMMCQFGDLSELKKCPALEKIIIDDCHSDFDIKWIEGTGVKDLHISVSSWGGLKNIDSVTTLKNLEHLLLFFTGISEQSVKKIKKALPDCKIEVWTFDANYDFVTKIY